MFKIETSVLQDSVARIKGGAEKASLAKGHIFVSAKAAEQEVVLYFVSEHLQVQKTLQAKVEKDASFAVVASEFALKVGALPKDELVTFKEKGLGITLAWGRNSSIALQVATESAPMIEIPETISSVKWPSGTIGYFTRNFTPFCALPNSTRVQAYPTVQGIYFTKNEMDQLVVEATNASRSINGTFDFEWFEENFAIPAETLLSLNAIISNESEIELGLNEKRTLLVVKCGNTVALSRILSGVFPDISGHYTDASANIVWRVDRMELLEVARRVKRLCAGIAGKEPVITLQKDGSQYSLNFPEVLTESIGAIVESDQAENIILDANNLETALTVLRSEEVLLTFKQTEQPVTAQSGDDESAETIRVMLAQIKSE